MTRKPYAQSMQVIYVLYFSSRTYSPPLSYLSLVPHNRHTKTSTEKEQFLVAQGEDVKSEIGKIGYDIIIGLSTTMRQEMLINIEGSTLLRDLDLRMIELSFTSRNRFLSRNDSLLDEGVGWASFA